MEIVNIRKKKKQKGAELVLPVTDYAETSMPGLKGAKLGVCYVRVTDLPAHLDHSLSFFFCSAGCAPPRRGLRSVYLIPFGCF